MDIRRIVKDEIPPMDLLLLADPSEQQVRSYLAASDCYVAELDDEIIGVYVVKEKDGHTMEVMNIAVAEQMQGRGTGKRLLLDAVERYRSKGYRTMEIGTGNSSIGQLALYQKCGFRIKEVIHDFFIDNYEEMIIENGIRCCDMIRLSKDL